MSPSEKLSIGRLSRAVGIPVETLRMWERRYGRPAPERLPSGHRRYTVDQVRWLRRVSEAMALGVRPGVAVRADENELTSILESGAPEAGSFLLSDAIEAMRRFDVEALRNELSQAWARAGAQTFLSDYLEPLLVHIGRLWATGEIQVRHEHFAAEVIEDFLRHRRQELERAGGSPLILLTTLPDESHGIGIQMAGLAATLHGASVRMLGVSTPIDEIATAASESGAEAVWVSISLATGGVESDRMIRELRSRLPQSVPIVIGGRGAASVRRSPRGVVLISDLAETREWMQLMRPASVDRTR